MTANGSKPWMASSVIAVMLFCALTTVSARAEVSNPGVVGHPEVANQLTSFKRTASAMRDHAGELHSITPNRQLHWRSHSSRLSTLKHQVNELGGMLASLEDLQHQANPGQRLAIEHARPHLAAVAEELTQAIQLVSEDRRSVYWPAYADRISNISSRATSLHETLDAILDYENARVRLDRLELLAPMEGS